MTVSFHHIVYNRIIDYKIILPTLYRFSQWKMSFPLFPATPNILFEVQAGFIGVQEK